ncbi:MAG: polysaccharide biosynthesis C-terminal domain-containing protein [Prevotellaceae bacterium]|jgi:O-antigen/teichoic acid export membrane protein|nr:polysaccharide biosynthesis C-terminal domain-containing protein [Prevotellaceae bacterium]
MNPLKRLAGDTAIYGLSTIVARLINYLLVAYHTRVLDRAQYGVFTEFYGYATFFLVLLTYGMETGFFRFSSRAGQRPDTVFSTSMVSLLATSLLFFAVVALNLSGFSAWMGYPGNRSYVLQMAAVLAIDAFTAIPFARLRFLRKAKLFALFKLLNVLLYVLVSVVFFTLLPPYFAQHPDSFLLRFFSPGVDVGYIFTANLLSSLLSLLLLLPTIFGVKLSFSPALLRRMLVYSLPLLIAGLPGVANDYLDRVLFKHLYSDASFALDQLGVYGANAKLAVLMVIFVQMFRYAAEPFFFAHAEKADTRPLFAQVMKYFVICAVFIFLLVSLNIDIFAYFTGKDFREGATIVPVMLFANLLLGVVFNLSMWYKLSEKTKYAVYITLSGVLVTVIVNVTFIPRYGYHAAAWAHFFSYAVMLAVSYAMGQKFYPIRYDLRAIGFYIFAGLGIYAIFALCKAFDFGFVANSILAAALLLAYLAVAFLRDGRALARSHRQRSAAGSARTS